MMRFTATLPLMGSTHKFGWSLCRWLPAPARTPRRPRKGAKQFPSNATTLHQNRRKLIVLNRLADAMAPFLPASGGDKTLFMDGATVSSTKVIAIRCLLYLKNLLDNQFFSLSGKVITKNNLVPTIS